MRRIVTLRRSAKAATSAAKQPISKAFTQDPNQDPTPIDPNQEAAVSIVDEDGWACRRDGQCDLFPGIPPSRVEVLHLSSKFRLFRVTQPQMPGKADHILTWCETKGRGVLVWSTFVAKIDRRPRHPPDRATKLRFIVPARASIVPPLRGNYARMIQRACSDASGRFQALGYTNITRTHGMREVMWSILGPGSDPAIK